MSKTIDSRDDGRAPEADSVHDHLRWKLGARTAGTDYGIFKTSHQQAFHPQTAAPMPFVLIEAGDWVNVIALTQAREVVLLRQYRAGSDRVSLEIPGGMIDPGEDPLTAARRELQEETGYTAPTWRQLGAVSPNPAIQSNRLHTFLAQGAVRSEAPTPDAGEVLLVESLPLSRCWDLLRTGAIDHALVLVAFGHLAFHHAAFADDGSF